MTDQAQLAVRDRVFISYRRDDGRGASGRLYDWLRIAFGRERVFRDVAGIGAGKWRDKIAGALARSAACVAVIGPRWANGDNLLRLQDVADMVRYELATALAMNDVTMVPALVEGAGVPSSAVLPDILKPLFDWNVRSVTEDGWEDDIRRLIAEIAAETRLPVGPDLDELLRNVAAAQQRVTELEQTRRLQAAQIEALHRSVAELRGRLAEAPGAERPGLAAAFDALARGDSLAAEDAFEREYEAQSRTADEARRSMAEAARNVGNLALMRDVAKAVGFYRKALAVDPEHAETHRLLGEALMLLGDVKGARDAFTSSLDAAIAHCDLWGEMAAQVGLCDVCQASGDLMAAKSAAEQALSIGEQQQARDPAKTAWQSGLSVSHDRIGNVLVVQGDGRAALAAYRKSLAIREALAAHVPGNTDWQRNLSVSHIMIGDVLVAQGDGSGALAAYRKSLAIGEALVARNAANIEWQRDLSVTHIKIGDVLVAQGDGPAALAAYRKSLAIGDALAARDPANTEWQRDLSVSHDKIGEMLVAQGDGPGALAAYRKSLAIGEALAARDPANSEWHRDLSLSHIKIGDVFVAQGNGPGALAAYRKSLAIHELLAARDPANTQWQRDLSVSHNKIGDVLVAQGDEQGALAAYRRSLAIAEALAARDPANAQWHRDLSISHERIGGALVTHGDWPGALAAYRKSLAIREALAARDPANIDWQRDLSFGQIKFGDVLVDRGDGPGKLAAYLYRQSLAISEGLATRDPANIQWQRDLSASHDRIGDVLVAQGDVPGALAAYCRSLALVEALAARDPTNAQWQMDLAVLCAKLGMLDHAQDVEARRALLLRGRAILLNLKSSGRLMPSADWTGWFEQRLLELQPVQPER